MLKSKERRNTANEPDTVSLALKVHSCKFEKLWSYNHFNKKHSIKFHWKVQWLMFASYRDSKILIFLNPYKSLYILEYQTIYRPYF